MKILLIGNYAPDRQYSMLGFSAALLEGMKAREIQARDIQARDIEVRLLAPEPVLGKYPLPGGKKWLGYLDKFAVFPRPLRQAIAWADVVHLCDQGNAIYTRYLGNKPHLVTCHDVLAIRSAMGHLPDWNTSATGKIFQRMIFNGLKQAQHIVCVSQSSQSDLLACGLPADRTEVIYNGFYRKSEPVVEAQRQPLLTAIGLQPGEDFLLHVGGNQHYKNRPGLLRIFKALRAHPEFRAMRLVMAGKPFSQGLRETLHRESLENAVLECVGMSNEQIGALYSQASALLFPSLYEGFGLPIIEAQACGCPVFTSLRPPMTEVGGDAAIYFDPTQPEQAAATISTHWAERAEMRRKGLENIGRFTTENMLDGYLNVYRRLRDQSVNRRSAE